MARAGAATARKLIVCCALGATLFAQAAAPNFADAVEREWRIRDAALARASDLTERIEQSTSIEERLALLEAVRRQLASASSESAALDAWLERKCAALDAGSVRADELAAWLRARAECAREAELLDISRALDHRLPAVRLELARACSKGPALRALVLDIDERVARAALETMVLSETRELGDIAAHLAFEVHDLERFGELVALVDTAGGAAASLDALRAIVDAPEFPGGEAAGWRATLEASRLRWRGECDAGALLGGWGGPHAIERNFERVFERAAQTARLRAPQLGAQLFEQFEVADDGDRRALLLSSVIYALGPEAAAAAALSSAKLSDDRRAELWRRFRGRDARWRAEDLVPWLTPERDVEVRSEVVDVLRAASHDVASAAVEAVLARALLDESFDVVEIAFGGLCDSEDATEWIGELRAAWVRFDEPKRLELLGELPRDVALPEFRDDLIALGERGGDARTCTLDLLAAFAPDDALAARVDAWLDAETRELASEPGALDRGAELRAAGLVSTLHKLSEGRAVAAMERTLSKVGARSNEIGKRAIWSLGQSETGRSRLPSWLATSAPSRLRIEAELMLVPFGDARAFEGLVRDFERCDLQLKGRAIEACGALDTPQATAFVRRMARDDEVDLQLRLRAIDKLAPDGGREGDVETLRELARSLNLELARHAIEAWVGVGGAAVSEFVRTRMAEVERELAELGGGDPALLIAERQTLLSGLGTLGVFDDAAIAAWARLCDESAAADVRARFRGVRQPQAEVAWRAELDYARALANAKKLAPALAANATWTHWDSALLEALGSVAVDANELNAGRRVLAAAHVALLGEADGDEHRSRVFHVRYKLLAAAERAQDWAAFELLSTALLDDVRAERINTRVFERMFAGFDPAAGVDGFALLDSARSQARARAALERGQLDEARRRRAEAARLVGFSAAAAQAQERLDRALAGLSTK